MENTPLNKFIKKLHPNPGATCTVYKVVYDWSNKTMGKQHKTYNAS